MKARPILFSGPMVRALLDDRKTQTRRIAKGAVLDWLDSGLEPAFCAEAGNLLCPYGVPGDLLIVREMTRFPDEFDHLKPSQIPERGRAHIHYEADGWVDGLGKGRPSIHMPRWASRLTLEVTEVRVERLQDISEADAQAEGIATLGSNTLSYGVEDMGRDRSPIYAPTARLAYRYLWDQVNGPDSWVANPWVWAVSFKVHRRNVDAFIQEGKKG